MATNEEIIAKAKVSIINFNGKAAEEAAQEAIDAKLDIMEFLENGFTAAMDEIEEKFETGEIFISHVIAASEAMNAGMNILMPYIEKSTEDDKIATVVLGTVAGDNHSIGKEIVAAMLKIAGFEVVDLGRSVPIDTFVEAAMKNGAQVVGSSALMTSTMVKQRDIEEALKEAGIRTQVKTMVGGAPVSQEWADKIGADIYAENANDVVNQLKGLFAN